MSTTPRYDNAKEQYLTGKMGIYGVLDETRRLETELAIAKQESDLDRTRIASIFWSGVLDAYTGGDVQMWAAEYTKERTRLRARAEKAEAEVAALKRPLLRLTSLWHQLFFLLDITEESDSGNTFRPNYISSCRAIDAERIDKILAEAKQLINTNVKNEQP